MIIVTAKNSSEWEHHPDFEDKWYGAILQKDKLLEVLQLPFCVLRKEGLESCRQKKW